MKYKITPFIVGRCNAPAARLIYLGDSDKLLHNCNSFFLIQGNDKNILIDVGFTDEFCKKFTDGITHEKNQDPLIQLESAGIKANDITDIILTHAHFDHLSESINEYKNAKIYIQKNEYDFIMNPPDEWFQKFIDIDLLKELNDKSRLSFIDGDCELFEGIKIISTSGHTVGHQSVLVDTEDGKYCFAGDSIINYESLKTGMGPGFNSNYIECLKSVKKLQKLEKQGVKIVISDDPNMLKQFPNHKSQNYEIQNPKSELRSPKSYCIIGHLKPECIEEYVDKHINQHNGVHKELLNVIKNSGILTEKIYIHENMIIIYFEAEDLNKSYEIQGKSDVLKQWNEIMKPLFDDRYEFNDDKSPFPILEKIYDLNQQLEGKLEQ